MGIKIDKLFMSVFSVWAINSERNHAPTVYLAIASSLSSAPNPGPFGISIYPSPEILIGSFKRTSLISGVHIVGSNKYSKYGQFGIDPVACKLAATHRPPIPPV